MPISQHALRDHIDGVAPFYASAVYGNMPDTHFTAIGRFMATCAFHESSLHSGLRYMMKMDEEQARALVDQPRINQLTQTIVNLCEIAKWDEIELAQLKKLRADILYVYAVRNVVAHHSAAWRGEWLRFDKYGTAKNINDPAKLLYVTTVEELDNLSTLLMQIITCMSQLVIPEIPVREANSANIATLDAFKLTAALPPHPNANRAA